MKVRCNGKNDISYILIKERSIENTINVDDDIYIEIGANKGIYRI